ncbi:MAG: S8 family serine peptidase [Candidatus Aminicenantes bacterium]|nr:S8 family serine peptidase [Candidatus Aminicenantes bacterium]
MRRPAAAGLIFALFAAAILSGRASSPDKPPARNERSPLGLPARSLQPKLDAALSRFLQVRTSRGREEAAAFASVRGLAADNGSLQVVVEGRVFSRGKTAGNEIDLLAGRISARGGQIQARYRNLIQALIPINNLAVWALDPRVLRIRAPRRPVPHKSISEGVALTGAEAWAELPPFHVYPVKIGILDIGFSGYQNLLGTDLPDKVETKSFRQDKDLEAGEPHGAACAEIVHDMAPGAALFLANFDTDVEMYQAIEWFDQKGVDVVSCSVGWYNAGPGDGTGPLCDVVDEASDRGLVWAASAGNNADSHWDGEFTDRDNDGIHEFAPGDEILSFNVRGGETIGVFLNWKDWGTWTGWDFTGTDQDYDLVLWRWTGLDWIAVDRASAVQNGGDWPAEDIWGYSFPQDATFGVSIVRARADRPMRLEVFTYGNSNTIEHNVPSRSLTSPADAARAWTAGASDAVGDFYHYYSSQGPAWDGRIKPDFAAPSGVSTTTYGYRDFYGTSASAPHLAGALGLLIGGADFTLDQVRTILESRAADLGDPGPDNLFGWGRINLKK